MVAKPRRQMKPLDDQQLRRESPAYQPDGDWQELEPQAMNVVLSVRFDARSARRIVDLAEESGRSASAMVRDWTLERLASSGAPLSAGHAVGESVVNYDNAGSQHEMLRERFRPGVIDILLIGESRPAGGTFFYSANSNLFYATHEAFQLALGPMPPDYEFLDYLRRRGVWLYDIADAPVNRLRGRPRLEAVQGRVGPLIELMREARPRLVVAIKKDLEASVRHALITAGLGAERLRVLPFPLYQWRAAYVRGLAAIVTEPPGS